jgi:hypothetical protein
MLRGAKIFLRRTLSARWRRVARGRWEDLRDWIAVVALALRFTAARAPLPRFLLFFGFAPGDDLLCTAVLRELRGRGRSSLMMVSNHLELFIGNDDPAYVRPLWRRYSMYDSTVSICRRFARICGCEFTRVEYAPPADVDRRRPPSRHVIAEMCARAGITGPVSIRPYLFLTDEERRWAEWARGKIVIQSGGMSARHPAQNKQWFPERFQAVVNLLQEDVEFVQLGSIEDPPLANAKDLRGATTMRQSASVLYQARLHVGHEGFLMHLARAVECPSVIIFGGRVAPHQIGYTCNLNLYSALPCAPCWQTNSCDFGRQCMKDISAADVVAAIRQMLERPRGPLAVDVAEILAVGSTGSPSRTAVALGCKD